jgi:hypothetical protein
MKISVREQRSGAANSGGGEIRCKLAAVPRTLLDAPR